MPTRKLTQQNVTTLTCPSDKVSVYYWDTECKKFGLRVYRSGERYYALQYRMPGQKNPSFQKIAEIGEMKLKAVRALAEDYKGDIRKGINPFETTQDKPTVNDMWVDWIKFLKKLGKPGEQTIKEYERQLERYVRKSKLGKKPIDKVTTGDCNKWMINMAGTPDQANKVKNNLSRVWKHAGKQDAVSDGKNPWTQIDNYVLTPHRPRFSNKDRVREVMTYLKGMIKAGCQREQDEKRWWIMPYFMLLVYRTGARPSEIATLRISELVIDHEEPHVAKEKTKSGAKAIPLSSGELMIIRDCMRHLALHYPDSDYFFPSINDVNKPIQNYRHFIDRMRRDGVLGNETAYSFRRWFVSTGREKIGLTGTKEVIDHEDESTTEIYAGESEIEKMRELKQRAQHNRQIQEELEALFDEAPSKRMVNESNENILQFNTRK